MPPIHAKRLSAKLAVVVLAGLLAGCQGLHRGDPLQWYVSQNGIPPRDGNRVSVCHSFGCQLKTTVTFDERDIGRMRRLIGNGGPREEREGIRRMIAWAETRVAPAAGSADDFPGLDLGNAGVPGQMDCIDEASNTTSYLLVAERNGLLRHHRVGKPVARGFFLDGRYPHATAVIIEKTDGTPWAVDSWPHRNGEKPDMMTLQAWFAASPAR